MPTAAVNGIEIYFERHGEGPRLLFVNGSGATLERLGPLLDILAAQFDLLAHDQRGLGKTEIPPDPYSMADYAADIAGLLDHVGWDSCRVMGVSFGGMVAQEYAVTWPKRVERLALLCTSPGGVSRSSYPLHELERLDPAERAARATQLLDSRFTPEWLAEHPGDRMMVEGFAGGGMTAGLSEEQRRGAAAQLDARRFHDVFDRLDRITCPTLVAAGRYDGIAPVSNSEAIVAAIPGAELRVYDGGHAFFAQDPAALPEVLAFLDGDQAAGATG
ncbi:alpha/beta fold hydrolase [Pseudofrankia inefficax]|uniref:Alpha/beta hydrolase fold protein n=1 Tax=Pseudofrankia inefficax (strain DSM 45817 / CECT 9037 / DDB 130130 / EuI1c) TaxID=298654 RepID=E3IVV7_PSEI1|nr:alpha/beta fold hydrolase [Pseudofrankia inefficax]ADP83759.1 alpha/beta hydrolase fold protein [Pseudofrankia inefficax]